MLTQFSEVKNTLIHFAFADRQKKILSTDITLNMLEELRRERKILMVIRDQGVEDYINFDLSEIDLEASNHDLKIN